MKSLVFSQAGVYRLQQLSTLVRQKTGVRHHLSDMKSTITLLRFSCTSPDSMIYDAFSYFSDELDDEQREYLQNRGLLIPPKISVTALHQTDTLESRSPIAR
jgi:hypothetical protein